MSWQKGLYDALAGDVTLAALVGDRIYPLVAPRGIDQPYIVFQLISSVPEQVLSGPAGLELARVQISCYGKIFEDAKAVAAVVETLFKNHTGTWNTVPVRTYILNQSDNHEVAANLTRVIFDIRVNLTTS